MKNLIVGSFVLSATAASALKITLFQDLETYIGRGQQMILARCQAAHTFDEQIANKRIIVDGLLPADVEAIRTLKGTNRPGPLTISMLRQNPQGADLVRLNIALLLDAYPQGLWRDQDLEREKPLLEMATKEKPSTP